MAIELLSSSSDSDFMDSVKHRSPKQALALSSGLLSDKDKAIEVFDLSSNSEENIGFTKLGAPKKRKYLKPADFAIELSSEMEPETEDEFCAKKKKEKTNSRAQMVILCVRNVKVVKKKNLVLNRTVIKEVVVTLCQLWA